MSDFYVGQKVVCVDGSKWPGCGCGDETYPVQGTVYTIREIFPVWCARSGEGPGIVLEEIVNRPMAYNYGLREGRFHHSRFRPAKSTNIEVFQKMLKVNPIRELAPTHSND